MYEYVCRVNEYVCRGVNEYVCRVNVFACRVAVNGYVYRVNDSYENATPQHRIPVCLACAA